MIQNFRQLKDRIKSIENTRKITRAMEMVSAAKLAKAKAAFYSSKPYFSNIERSLLNLLSDIAPSSHPLVNDRTVKRSACILVVASDAGLCSTYNHAVIKTDKDFADSLAGRESILVVPVGKEAMSFFAKEGYDIETSYVGLRGRFSVNGAADITKTLTDVYLSGRADEVYAAYTHFSPNLKHRPAVEKILNIEYEAADKRHYILEPGREIILDALIAKYVSGKVASILLDSLTAEHSARMLAMKLATDNADELIDTLTLLKNKARQAAITKEVLEIATSAEALKI